jgi:hypothetical protein
LGDDTYDSLMEVGGYSTTYMRDASNIKWFPQTAGDFWFTAPVTGLRYSTQDVHPLDSSVTSSY